MSVMSVCQWTKRVERYTGRSLPHIFTKLNCHQGRAPGDVITYCLCVNKPKVKLILALLLTENSFNVKYLENGEKLIEIMILK